MALREPWALWAPDGLVAGISSPRPLKAASRRNSGNRLTNSILAHLPLAVAVIGADSRLFFWNEQAACLFGAPPMMAEANPGLADILAGTQTLTQSQRDRIVAFANEHITAGDRTEPDSYLRLSLGRERRIAIQVYGLGSARWMLVLDEGKMNVAGNSAGPGAGDALLDALTGLSNRRHFNHRLRTATEDANHAVLLIDLDHFARINDALGHPVGDALLCLVGQRLRRELREDDSLARLGGDEFAILITNCDAADALAGRVVDMLSSPFRVEGHLVSISASIGIARGSRDGISGDDLMRHAELALYEAKTNGRRTWRVFEADMAIQAMLRRDMETDLRRALTVGEMSVAYKAKTDPRTGALTGFDASPHWNHATRGVVDPKVFILLAEATGCIVALDEWMLTAACAEAVCWPVPLMVALTVSRQALIDGDHLWRTVQSALDASGLAPDRLELATAADPIAASVAPVRRTLDRLGAAGVVVALAGPAADSAAPNADAGGCQSSQILLASDVDALLRRYVPALEKVSVSG